LNQLIGIKAADFRFFWFLVPIPEGEVGEQMSDAPISFSANNHAELVLSGLST